jgi:hypothetical protein
MRMAVGASLLVAVLATASLAIAIADGDWWRASAWGTAMACAVGAALSTRAMEDWREIAQLWRQAAERWQEHVDQLERAVDDVFGEDRRGD